MEDIVNEIVKIDSHVYDKKAQSEEQVKLRKEYYENQMNDYEKTRLEEASEKAEESYNHIIEAAKQQYEFQEEKAKQVCLLIENKYLQVEAQLLDEVFSKMFLMEV